MHMTEDMKRVRHELQFLSASDPTAAANISRHAIALIVLVLVSGTGHRERRGAESEISGGFELIDGEERFLMSATSIMGVAQLFLGFDVDDTAVLQSASLCSERKAERSPTTTVASSGRRRTTAALVAPRASVDHGHLAFKRGSSLRHVPGRPPSPL